MSLRLAANGEHHRVGDTSGWLIVTLRHQTQASSQGHLTFASKYESLNLAVLRQLFRAIRPVPIADWVHEEPTDSYIRRICFLFEWLVVNQIDLADAMGGRQFAVLNDRLLFGGPSTSSSRHRVINNLLSNSNFFPLVYRTATLQAYSEREPTETAQEVVVKVPRNLHIERMTAFLLLKDSRSSYATEGERPLQDRIQRWGHAIDKSGQLDLKRNELLWFHLIVIGGERPIKLGFWHEDDFVGTHDHESRKPLWDHFSARLESPNSLIYGGSVRILYAHPLVFLAWSG